MSVQSALQAGVAGISSQSRRFASIADNIANAQTTGYKRSEIAFATQVIDAGLKNAYTAAGVNTTVNRQIERAGSIQNSERSTDLAINGAGFFLVKGGTAETQALEKLLLTRTGASSLDAEGYLRLDNGFFLQGTPVGADGSVIQRIPESIRIDKVPSTPTPTGKITFKTNLPSDLAQGTEGDVISTTIGYIDQLGSERALRFDWTPAAGNVANTWSLTVTEVATEEGATAADPANTLILAPLAFNATGAQAGRLDGTLPGVGADGLVAFSLDDGTTIKLDLQLTQFDYAYAPLFGHDGIAASDFSGIEVGEEGTVYSVYKNGTREPRFKLSMAEVPNPGGLEPLSGNAYMTTRESGELLQRYPGEGSVGFIRAFSVEGSNVDIAEELTSMITTQRAYSANASVITTSDQMLEEVIRLKR
jgi:flagellar hook protein FlgE